MATFIVLHRDSDTAQVNITMSDGAASGDWHAESTSTATLEFDHGTYLQTTYSDQPADVRHLHGPGNAPLLTLNGFLTSGNSGTVNFDLADTTGSFGTAPAIWTRLEG